MKRRQLLEVLASAPLLSLACSSAPKTPLAHLHGQGWVHGAYSHYAKTYLDIQASAESRSNDAYRVLAQRGIASLDALQTREVPFFIRVAPDSDRFEILRQVPERLMFSADMSEADRQAATADWKLARDHIHTDYDQIHVLNWALTSLLQQLQALRNTIDSTQEEQFRLARQLTELDEGRLPYELPYQVTAKDYGHVLYLLLDRLNDDRRRLEIMESSIVSVGLTARATDANSGSLAANLDKVLLAVVTDSSRSAPRAFSYPETKDRDDEFAGAGARLHHEILASPAFQAWLREEKNRELQQLGAFLTIIDTLTGIPASSIYKQAVAIWTGDGDYLQYLITAARMIPGGGEVAKVIAGAIEKTQQVRRVATKVGDAVRGGAIPNLPAPPGLINVGSRFARSRLARQIVFFHDRAEAEKVRGELAATDILRGALPEILR